MRTKFNTAKFTTVGAVSTGLVLVAALAGCGSDNSD